eukprot:2477160-Amphidinium_carterae.1
MGELQGVASNAVLVPGLCHIANNIYDDLDKRLADMARETASNNTAFAPACWMESPTVPSCSTAPDDVGKTEDAAKAVQIIADGPTTENTLSVKDITAAISSEWFWTCGKLVFTLDATITRFNS